jgi:L-ectoine synthase
MKIVRLDDIVGTDREVSAEGWTSRRLLLAHDQMGFSLHDTLIHEGAELHMTYKHHLEAVYCIEGQGSIELVATGEVTKLGPGTVYALDQHDPHILRAQTQMRMVCVFNPPVTGKEVHGPDGAYPPPGEG